MSSFCETVAATGIWHLRLVDDRGQKPRGISFKTRTLCGLRPAWDLEVEVTDFHLDNNTCGRCLDVYRDSIERLEYNKQVELAREINGALEEFEMGAMTADQFSAWLKNRAKNDDDYGPLFEGRPAPLDWADRLARQIVRDAFDIDEASAGIVEFLFGRPSGPPDAKRVAWAMAASLAPQLRCPDLESLHEVVQVDLDPILAHLASKLDAKGLTGEANVLRDAVDVLQSNDLTVVPFRPKEENP